MLANNINASHLCSQVLLAYCTIAPVCHKGMFVVIDSLWSDLIDVQLPCSYKQRAALAFCHQHTAMSRQMLTQLLYISPVSKL